MMIKAECFVLIGIKNLKLFNNLFVTKPEKKEIAYLCSELKNSYL